MPREDRQLLMLRFVRDVDQSVDYGEVSTQNTFVHAVNVHQDQFFVFYLYRSQTQNLACFMSVLREKWHRERSSVAHRRTTVLTSNLSMTEDG